MLQYFIAEQTYLYFQSTITDTSHILSTITLAKYLSTQCAEAFKPHDIGTYLFSITPSFPMSNQDQVKHWLGSVNIGLDQLISVWISLYWFRLVNIGLDRLILVWISYYRSRSVNISLDGLNVKKYWLISVKCWLRLTDINR